MCREVYEEDMVSIHPDVASLLLCLAFGGRDNIDLVALGKAGGAVEEDFLRYSEMPVGSHHQKRLPTIPKVCLTQLEIKTLKTLGAAQVPVECISTSRSRKLNTKSIVTSARRFISHTDLYSASYLSITHML